MPTALADLTTLLNQTGTRLFFQHEVDSNQPPDDFSPAQTRQLYRITGELLNNLLKHAGATRGYVVLRQTALGWQLSVADNGQGFDTARPEVAEGIGLGNVHARAQLLNATVQIQSGAGGTTVVVAG